MTKIWVNHFGVLDENINFSKIIIIVFLIHWGAQRKECNFLIINKFYFLVDFRDRWWQLSVIWWLKHPQQCRADFPEPDCIKWRQGLFIFLPLELEYSILQLKKNHSYLGHFLRYMIGSVHFSTQIFIGF